MKLDQKGFGVIEILVAIIIIGLLGAVGWLVYDRQKSPKQESITNQATSNQLEAKAEDTPKVTRQTQQKYLEIKEWGVKLPVGDQLSSIRFDEPATSGYSEADQSVTIITPSLDSAWTCTSDSGLKGSIGKISRTSQDKRSGPYEPLATKKIATYTYGFEPGGNNCTTSPEYSKLVEAFKSAFNALVAK